MIPLLQNADSQIAHIAGYQKSDDLAAAIRQQPKAAREALNNKIDAWGGLALLHQMIARGESLYRGARLFQYELFVLRQNCVVLELEDEACKVRVQLIR